MYKYVSSDDVKMLVFSDSNFKSESSYGIIIFNRIVNTNSSLTESQYHLCYIKGKLISNKGKHYLAYIEVLYIYLY